MSLFTVSKIHATKTSPSQEWSCLTLFQSWLSAQGAERLDGQNWIESDILTTLSHWWQDILQTVYKAVDFWWFIENSWLSTIIDCGWDFVPPFWSRHAPLPRTESDATTTETKQGKEGYIVCRKSHKDWRLCCRSPHWSCLASRTLLWFRWIQIKTSFSVCCLLKKLNDSCFSHKWAQRLSVPPPFEAFYRGSWGWMRMHGINT